MLPDDDPDKVFNPTGIGIGITDTFEAPAVADLILDTHTDSPERSAEKLYRFRTIHRILRKN
jgi:adenylylsulfate kinase-like enzyme